MRVAFATCADIPDGWDDPAAAALLGAEFRVWNDPAVDWHAYDRVVVRSTWDYSWHLDAFLAWCEAVGPSRLRNSAATIAWNVAKTYLRELAVPIVPTRFLAPGESLPDDDGGEIVVKPHISAGARDTGRFGDRAAAAELVARIHASGRIALVQSYLPSVESEGETSVVFLGGAASHVLHKRAVLRREGIAPLAAGERAVAAAMLEPDLVVAGTADAAQLALAQAAHDEVARRFGAPLYARVDLLRDSDGAPVLSELELAEPGLYLATAPGSAERFAQAIRES